MEQPGPAEIVVVGSANLDLVVPVPRLPTPGQTVLGGDHLRVPGGKGANQAVAAAKLDRRVAMVGRVGADDAGATLLDSLRAAGVDVAHLTVTPEAPSGIALIMVEPGGENTIAVSPGANRRLAPADVRAAQPLLAEAAVTLLQLEVDLEVVAAAAAAAAGTVVLNPAPAAALSPSLLGHVDVLVPNRSELGLLAEVDEPRSIEAAIAAVRRLPGGLDVVVTLGAEGALVVEDGAATHVPAVPVDAVDATGAGDAFCGGLADGLARGASLTEATGWAVRVAGLATTRWGAQPAMPTRDEVLAAAG